MEEPTVLAERLDSRIEYFDRKNQEESRELKKEGGAGDVVRSLMQTAAGQSLRQSQKTEHQLLKLVLGSESRLRDHYASWFEYCSETPITQHFTLRRAESLGAATLELI